MDLDHIRTFVTIARGLSFSRAAQVLHRSQPAISRRIELMEREFGVRLFERQGGRAILTEAGKAIRPHAEAMLAAATDTVAALAALRRAGGESVTIALVSALANTTLTDVLRKIGRRFPKVNLKLQMGTSAEVTEMVLRGEASIGLRYFDIPTPGLISQRVWDEPLALVAAAGHRLADGRRHRSPDLAGERWIAFSAHSGRNLQLRLLLEKLDSLGLADAEVVPVETSMAQKRLVEAGFGVALLPECAIDEELHRGTLQRINVPELRESIAVTLVYRKGAYLSEAARHLIALIGAAERKS